MFDKILVALAIVVTLTVTIASMTGMLLVGIYSIAAILAMAG